MNEVKEWQSVITNACTCQIYIPLSDTYSDATVCYGECQSANEELLEHDLGDWWSSNPTNLWAVKGLPLWDRDADFIFQTDDYFDIDEFIRAITVNGEWILRYRLDGEILTAHLSHHDCPTGKSFTITYAQIAHGT